MNPKGVLAVNPNESRTILCCPAQLSNEKYLGVVQVYDLGSLQNEPLKIKAHQNSLNIIELNNDGTILATSSERVRWHDSGNTDPAVRHEDRERSAGGAERQRQSEYLFADV